MKNLNLYEIHTEVAKYYLLAHDIEKIEGTFLPVFTDDPRTASTLEEIMLNINYVYSFKYVGKFTALKGV